MKRLALMPLVALAAGCVVRTYQPAPPPYGPPPAPPPPVAQEPPPAYAPPPTYVPPPPPPAPRVFYGGEHAIPASAGGGWCYISSPHEHDYYPDVLDNFS